MNTLIEKVLFFVVFLITLFFSFKGFYKKTKLVLSGKDIKRSDNIFKRILIAIRNAFLQICTIKNRPITGIFHSSMFWGFVVFAFITLNHVYEGFTHKVLYGNSWFYKALIFLGNFFALFILTAITYFILRRYVFKVKTLERPSYQSLIILIFIFILMVSFVFYEAYKGYSNEIESFNFVAKFVKANILSNNLSASSVNFGKSFMWWIHILIIFAFAVFIPNSKHLHLVAGPINIMFKNNGPLVDLPVENLEDAEKFGIVNINDYTKKDLLDLFSCAECGRCEEVCPAFNSGKDLSPKNLLSKLKDNLLESYEELMKKGENLKVLLDDVVSREEVWDCTTCGACLTVCPMFNEHISKIIGLRQYAVMMEAKFPEEFNVMFRGIENQGNPWGIGADKRSEWAEGLDIPVMADKKKTDVLLWIGCEGSFDSNAQKNTKDFIKILKKSGIDFAFLGNEEMCCGDPLRRTGHEYMFQIMASQNIETLKQYEFNTIVTMCPHGYFVLKNEYPKLGGDFNVKHYTEFLSQLIKENKIKVNKKISGKFTYHDPCYIGRYSEIYEEPRELIKLTGAELVEMKDNREKSFCCGAGGGGMWKEESKGERMNYIRIKQAKKTNVETIITACPYCSLMFKDGIEETETKGLDTKDLSSVILESLE